MFDLEQFKRIVKTGSYAPICTQWVEEFESVQSQLIQAQERVKKLEEALVYALERINHSCNIEYGNNTGVENCVVCIARKALKGAT